MARKIKRDEVLRRIQAAGTDGVPADPAKLLKSWGIDGDPRQLRMMLNEMTSSGDACPVDRKMGDGRFHRFIVA